MSFDLVNVNSISTINVMKFATTEKAGDDELDVRVRDVREIELNG